jgi:cell division protein FtsB
MGRAPADAASPGPAADPEAGRSPEAAARDRAELKSKAWRLLLAAVAGSLVVFTIAGDRGAITLYRKWTERRTLQEKIHRLEAENARKRHENKQLESDPRAVETIAREDLDMVRPGEIMFVLPGEEAPATPKPEAPAATPAAP